MQLQSISSTVTYTKNNKTELVWGGNKYFDLLGRLIGNAHTCIHLQYYIFEDDDIGTYIGNLLMQAAQRGVKVYFIADGYASRNLKASFIRELRRSGVYFSYFEPLFRSHKFYFGRRLHHKVVVVDGAEAIVGGVNVSDRYNDSPARKAWLDMAVYIKGDTAGELDKVCSGLWNKSFSQPMAYPVSITEQQLWQNNGRQVSVRIRRNDWVNREMQIWKSYSDLFSNARKEIIAISSYFLPGWKLRKQMRTAARRGVTISIVVAGRSDVKIAKQAERFLYKWMFETGIRVFEYQKNILHAKAAVADKKFMTIGSYNINNISSYASIELNLDIRNTPFVSRVQKELENLIDKDCIEILPESYSTETSWILQIWQRLCYEVIKIVFYLFTFYFRQQRTY